MKRLRRNYRPGGTYFFTVVTQARRPILDSDLGRSCLRRAIEYELTRRTFELSAIVLLPNHLHAIWRLPPGDSDYSLRWSRIKDRFTREYLAGGGTEGDRTTNRIRHRERAVWQHRFWEHTIDSEADFKRCLDYIHWNPVKHGIAKLPSEYPWSSFSKWVSLGEYDFGWGSGDIPDVPGAEWD